MTRLQDMSKEEYEALMKSGMMFEFYPEATGNYHEDCYLPALQEKFCKEIDRLEDLNLVGKAKKRLKERVEGIGVDLDYHYTLQDKEPERSVSSETHYTTLDVQVGGNHYKKYKIQPVEFSMANNLNYCQANIVKYVVRYKDKNGIEDLEKAKHYIDLLIELENNAE